MNKANQGSNLKEDPLPRNSTRIGLVKEKYTKKEYYIVCMLFDAIEYADMTYLMSQYYYVYDTIIHCNDRSKQVFGFALRKARVLKTKMLMNLASSLVQLCMLI